MSIININGMVFYILLIQVIKNSINNKVYRIPFSQHNYEYIFNTRTNYSNIAESIFFNVIYINLSLGEPPQTIPFHLNINSQAFYTTDKYYFIPNKSKTYDSISYNEQSFNYDDLKKGIIFKDYIQLNNNMQNKTKIEFIYGTEIKKNNNLGNIGLLIPDSKTNKKNKYESSFFSALKKSNLIDSYSWTIKFYNNINIIDTIYTYAKEGKYIGEFIIGEEPHKYELDKKVYDETKLIKVNALYDFDGIFWDVFFNDIYMNIKLNNSETKQKIEIYGHRQAEINPDLGFIVGTNEYFSSIHKNFFNKYKNICKEKQINNTLFKYIECEKNSIFNLSSFPDIFFESKSFETIFNLTYEDLFIFDEINNKYIFLIINNRYISRWVFGSIFLRKYQFVFNTDSKTIGYYKSMNYYKNDFIYNNSINKNANINTNINTNEKKENNKKYILYIIIGILFILFSILFIILGIFIQRKCLNYRRKKRVNELEDVDNDMEKNNNLIV